MPDKAANAKQADSAVRKRQAAQPAVQELDLLQEQIPPLTQSVQSVILDPSGGRPADFLALQRMAGNRAVSRLIQTKLTVGPAGDRYEQEADRVAEQVLTMPLPSPSRRGVGGGVQPFGGPSASLRTGLRAQRQEEEEVMAKPLHQRQPKEEELQMRPVAGQQVLQRQEEEEDLQMRPVAGQQVLQRQEDEEELQMKPVAGQQVLQRQEDEEELQMKPVAGQLVLQRQEDEEELQMKPVAGQQVLQRQEEEEELQAKPSVQRQGGGGLEARPELENRLAAQKGGGRPLPEEARAFMEPRFGADFSGVRVHTGSEAVQLNRELKAQAFTHGRDVYFGTGGYEPATDAGKRLHSRRKTSGRNGKQSGPKSRG
jgi:hypothetical protein